MAIWREMNQVQWKENRKGGEIGELDYDDVPWKFPTTVDEPDDEKKTKKPVKHKTAKKSAKKARRLF
jgi:hypothetical protein